MFNHESWDRYNIRAALYQVTNLKLGLIKPNRKVLQSTIDNNKRYIDILDNEIKEYYAYKEKYKLTSRFE